MREALELNRYLNMKPFDKFIIFSEEHVNTFIQWVDDSNLRYKILDYYVSTFGYEPFIPDTTLINYDYAISLRKRYVIKQMGIIIPLSVNAVVLLKLRLSFCEYKPNLGSYTAKM